MKSRGLTSLFACAIHAWSPASAAAEWPVTGRVVAVTDGATLTVLDGSSRQHKVRLRGIDAPEGKQPFGIRSRQNLAQMVAGEAVRAECGKRDRDGLVTCRVWVQPSDCKSCGLTLDVGHAQISAGMAWSRREYSGEQSAEDRGRYESEEQEARLRKRGLWSQADPVPPWEWRKTRRD